MTFLPEKLLKLWCLILFLSIIGVSCEANCTVPFVLRGLWFSRENNVNTYIEINDKAMTSRGECIDISNDRHVNYTIIFKPENTRHENNCYYCVRFMVRTINVLEKIETTCIDVPEHEARVSNNVCKSLDTNQQIITLFAQEYNPVNCRSSLEGVWNFSYQNRFMFTGECNHPEAQIRSCQMAGSEFLVSSKTFNINYKKCPHVTGTSDALVEYACLGDWFVGRNHYFAVAKPRESRDHEKYRCFLKNLDNDLDIGVSNTAECNSLKTVEQSPERLHITPVQLEIIEPGCHLPQNFSGAWIDKAIVDTEILINETHIIETYYDEGHSRQTIYVCQEQRDTLIMMTRLTPDGCQKDYICFDFMPQHQNVIRYRKGTALVKNDYNTVCSVDQFESRERWRYDVYLKKKPTPIRCPIAGNYNFTQQGEVQFETQIVVGLTLPPLPGSHCKENISDFSVCDTEQKEITINENYCLSVNYFGRPINTYSDPDYKMKCIAFWKEDLLSYLITYDRRDLYSKYRCWVYQRTDSNRILMSQASGPFCDINQDVTSWNQTEGAAVAIDMQEYIRDLNPCPIHFDDGEDPWKETKIEKEVVA